MFLANQDELKVKTHCCHLLKKKRKGKIKIKFLYIYQVCMCCNKSGRQDWNVIEAVKYLIKENVSQKNSLRWRFCFICCTCFDLQIREAVLKCIWMKLCVLSNVISIRVQKLDPFTHTHPSPPPPTPSFYSISV